MDGRGDMATDGRTEMSEETVFVQHHLELLEAEVRKTLELLPAVEDAQWAHSPSQTGPPELPDRRVVGKHGDPTGNTVADPSRLQLREQSKRSERLVRDALLKVRGVRRGLEISLVKWQHGEGA